MSVAAAESTSHSSDVEDFAAFLDGELDSVSDEELEIQSVERRTLNDSEYLEEIQETVSVSSSQPSSGKEREKDECSHPGFISQVCFLCNKKNEDDSGVNFNYILKDFRLVDDEIARLRVKYTKNLLRHKKLYMVLDLDHTLLNSTSISDVAPDEEYLRNPPNHMKGSLFMVHGMPVMTKLRPFVREFLKEANSLFEMYIYTMGDSRYAAAMATLLDPRKEYFVDRVISRDDSTQKDQKGLDLVIGQESAVIILDDTEAVWSRHMENVILIERYNFFASSCRHHKISRKSLAELKTDESESVGILATVLQVLKRIHSAFFKDVGEDHADKDVRQHKISCKSLAELKTDESESVGILATVLQVLKRIHSAFFKDVEEDLAKKDVRQVLKSLRSEILRGCKIVFSRVFPLHVQAETQYLWRLAEGLGAKCCTEVDPSVTHVVAADSGTEKSRWAVKENKFLVNQQWIEAANFLWKRLPEDDFPVNCTKNLRIC